MNALQRVLIVKLADIGDAVLALPAVQSLRAALPAASIDVLTTAAGAQVFRRSPSVNEVHVLANRGVDLAQPLGMFTLIRDAATCLFRIRMERYQCVVLLHHLTTANGARKHRLLVNAVGAPVVAGLDNGRGTFLTHRATDYGFGAMSEWEYGLQIIHSLGLDARPARPELEISLVADESAARLLTNLSGSERYIVIHPEVGEFSPARAWPLGHFITLARTLSEDSAAHIVFVGTQTSVAIEQLSANNARVLNLAGRTNFDELCAIVRRAELVIGADSALTHLAAAFSTPVVAIFGPSNLAAWKPFGAVTIEAGRTPVPGTTAVALTRGLPCSPCVYTGFGIGRPQGCESRSCITHLWPETVSNVASSMLAERQ